MKVTKRTRRKFTEQQVREYMLQFESSGMNRSRFAKVNRINYFTFIGWLYKRSHLIKDPETPRNLFRYLFHNRGRFLRR